MPIRYRCKYCGFVLYEFRGVGQSFMGVLTPSEVVKLVGHMCPNCKRVLETPRSSFKEFIGVKPVSQSVGAPKLIGITRQGLESPVPH